MKKVCLIILTLCLAVGALSAVAFAAVLPRMVIATETAAPGDTVALPVSLESNPGINTFTLSIVYDTTRLALTGVEAAPALGGTFIYTQRTETVGWQVGGDTAVTGDILYLNFTVLDSAPLGDAAVTVTYKSGNICNFDEEDVDFEIVPGGITVAEKECQHPSKTEKPAKAPTCLESGNHKYYICPDCGKVLKADGITETTADAEVIPATGHSFGAWTQTKAPTCTEKGQERRDCANCDHYETRDVAALGHDYKAVVTAPTCTEQGYTTHTCTHCADSYVDSYVEALGHTDGSVCDRCGEVLAVWGDVSGDGNVTVQDAILVLRYVAKLVDGNALDLTMADVNGDGNVTVQDAILILRYVAKLITQFPVQKQ